MARRTATDVARNFSDVLNRVAAGEEVEITRNGATVAVIAPPRIRLLTRAHFLEVMDAAPPVDEEFAEELRRLRRELGPPESPWPS